MNKHIQYAQLLLQQSRYDQALDETRRALSDDPNNAEALRLLSFCLSSKEQHDEAIDAAQQSIAHAPGSPESHYALGWALLRSGKRKPAQASMEQAIALNPYDSRYFYGLAAVHHSLERWQPMLDAADKGLAISPEDVDLTNVRATALMQLGRRAEAHEALDGALADSPNNAQSHANRGWTLLHQSKPKEAQHHFREALRLDPTSQWARAGLVEALKARIIVYRVLLAFFLWMTRLSSRARVGILIGGYIAYRVLGAAAANNPSLAPFVWPVLITYIVFVLMTWIGPAMFDLLLRVHPAGRFALSDRQRQTSNWFGIMLVLGLATLLVGVFGDMALMFLAGVRLLVMIIPVVHALSEEDKRMRTYRMIGVAVLTVLAFSSFIAVAMDDMELFQSTSTAFLYGYIAYIWLASFLGAARQRV